MANTEKSTDGQSDSNQSGGSNSPNLGVNFDRWVSLVNPTDLGRADGGRNIPGVEATHCDFDRKIQVAHHSPNDGQLLKIFFAEDRGVRRQQMKQLRHDRADTAKMPGARPAF